MYQGWRYIVTKPAALYYMREYKLLQPASMPDDFGAARSGPGGRASWRRPTGSSRCARRCSVIGHTLATIPLRLIGVPDLSAQAIARLNAGDVEGARALFQFVREQRTSVFGADDPSLADDLANLGNVLAEQGDLDAVEHGAPRRFVLLGGACYTRVNG